MYVTRAQEITPRERCHASKWPDHINQFKRSITKVIMYPITFLPSFKDVAFFKKPPIPPSRVFPASRTES